MKKIIFAVGALSIIFLVVFAAASLYQKSQRQVGKLSVVATLFPLYDFAKNIGGDRIELTLLLPPGVEAHAYEPKPSDIVRINSADLFLYTGKFMEPWVEDLSRGTGSGGVEIVDASSSIGLVRGDPHIWLDFDNARIMVETITKALVEKDPANTDFYRENSERYKTKLTKLDAEYQNALTNCLNREIIYGGHYTFGYLARRYNLNYQAAQGFSPDAEPTAKDLIGLVTQIKKEKISYIYYEELSSPKIAETLAKETNTKTLLLNGGHNLSKMDFESGVGFITIMEENLTNLRIGLRCN